MLFSFAVIIHTKSVPLLSPTHLFFRLNLEEIEKKMATSNIKKAKHFLNCSTESMYEESGHLKKGSGHSRNDNKW